MNKLNREIYKLAGYYIKCKQANLNNVDFIKKLNALSKKFDLSERSFFYLCGLFLFSKNDIIRKAIKMGAYFDKNIFIIPEDLRELNKKNIRR